EAHWKLVGMNHHSSCAAAMTGFQRVIVFDIEASEAITGTADQNAYRSSRIRSVQSTPLISRNGRLVGMISTHWRAPHRPSERKLRLFDVLARQAADLIEKRMADQTLRDADRRKDEFLALLAHELRSPLAAIHSAGLVLLHADGEASNLRTAA